MSASEYAGHEQTGGVVYDVTVRHQISWGVLLALVGLSLAGITAAPAQSPDATPNLEAIVEGMARARADNRASFRPYAVTRDYVLYGKEKAHSRSEVTARLTFVPPNSKRYAILQRTGSGLGERLVRRMLDGETTIVKDYGLTDISPDNYEFRLTGEETVNGRRCHVIEIFPRRADKTLIRGTIRVDAGTYLLHRMEGEPAQSPSWWLTGARITFFYGDVEGMWLQTASEFTTHVRIFGQHTMISRDVKYEPVEAPAPAAPLVGAKSPSGPMAEGQGRAGRGASQFPNP